MPTAFLDTPIAYLKGIGPTRSEVLKKELGVFTFRDFIYHFPFRYEDRTKIYTIRSIQSDQVYIQLCGTLHEIVQTGTGKGKRLTALFTDESGEIELVWFKGLKWIASTLKPGKKYLLYGKPVLFNASYNIIHPELEEITEDTMRNLSGFQAVYSTTEKLVAKGFTSKAISRLQRTLCLQAEGKIPDFIPTYLLERYQMPALENALRNVHIPDTSEALEKARKRLIFDEFFLLQLRLLKEKKVRQEKMPGFVFEKVGDYFHTFYHKHLSFELTNAQKRVLKEIRKDTQTARQMNRLLQGDVGSGKTIVAFMCMLLAADNNYQSCLMAPTEILATQHYDTLKPYADLLNLNIGFLTGSTKQAARKKIFQQLADGSMHIIIGTHALLEAPVVFKNLGFAVVDEQHRFGVAQRAALWKKNTMPPHVLVMTATPIPRTLAMTLYGDLDVSVMDELPPGRKPIQTLHKTESSRLRVFGFMKEQMDKGRQIYVVYPLIDESEKLDYQHLMRGFDTLYARFPPPNHQISIVHGKLPTADKDFQMQQFVQGKAQIMVATTVIEVGVNVPNASVMVIESAERFGLSQLHQLRGRVGRGAEQSYCILLTGNKLTSEARMRIETMVSTNNGFEIAEVDLKLRGPGEIQGTRQSGLLQFKIADMVKDEAMLKFARKLAEEILASDPDLQQPEHAALWQHLKQQTGNASWSRIS